MSVSKVMYPRRFGHAALGIQSMRATACCTFAEWIGERVVANANSARNAAVGGLNMAAKVQSPPLWPRRWTVWTVTRCIPGAEGWKDLLKRSQKHHLNFSGPSLVPTATLSASKSRDLGVARAKNTCPQEASQTPLSRGNFLEDLIKYLKISPFRRLIKVLLLTFLNFFHHNYNKSMQQKYW